MWRTALSHTMKQVEDASWWLSWDALGAHPREQQQHRPDNPHLDGKEPDMMRVVQCVNDAYNASARMTWEGAMADEESSVKVVGAWWKNHAPSDPVTVTTSGSVSRLPQLYAQCLTWSGPLSVVLYQALPVDESAGPDAPALTPANQAILRTAALQVRCHPVIG